MSLPVVGGVASLKRSTPLRYIHRIGSSALTRTTRSHVSELSHPYTDRASLARSARLTESLHRRRRIVSIAYYPIPITLPPKPRRASVSTFVSTPAPLPSLRCTVLRSPCGRVAYHKGWPPHSQRACSGCADPHRYATAQAQSPPFRSRCVALRRLSRPLRALVRTRPSLLSSSGSVRRLLTSRLSPCCGPVSLLSRPNSTPRACGSEHHPGSGVDHPGHSSIFRDCR